MAVEVEVGREGVGMVMGIVRLVVIVYCHSGHVRECMCVW